MYISQYQTNQVKVKNLLSDKFPSNIGVRKGDCLSPVLFNLYINEINNYLKTDYNSPNLGTRQLNHLLHADDLILFSTTNRGFKR